MEHKKSSQSQNQLKLKIKKCCARLGIFCFYLPDTGTVPVLPIWPWAIANCDKTCPFYGSVCKI